MLVTLLGIVTLARLEQYVNAASPMLMTPLAMVTFVRPQDENANGPM